MDANNAFHVSDGIAKTLLKNFKLQEIKFLFLQIV